MSRPKVLVLGEIEHASDAFESIAAIADIVVPKSATRTEFLSECRSGALDGALVAYRTFASFEQTGKVDEELVGALPASLRFVCHNGAGYDQVDVPACTARGIRVSNTPTAVDDSTADTAVFLILGALRNLNVAMFNLRRGEWRGREAPRLGRDPQGKVLGILGMGGIGRNLARKAGAFGMRVRYFNRSRLGEEVEREAGACYCSFEELLRDADVLSLNLPLNPSTRHTISTPQFAQMKRGVVIVNTARGAVMDEAALVAALDSGQVASAGLDVYEDEPEIHPGLMANPNVMLVPHMGTWTVETETKMEEWTLRNVRMALEEGRLLSIVPEQRGMMVMNGEAVCDDKGRRVNHEH